VRRFLVIGLVAAACGAPASHVAQPAPPPVAPAPPAEPSLPTGMPAGYVEMRPAQVVELPDGAALVLVDPAGTRALPIYIGGTEAASIDLRMRGASAPRPLTHDLLDALLRSLHATLVKVQVDDIRDDTYIGSIFVRANGRVFVLDARPSDAIALAIGDHAPIYVASAVLAQGGMPLDQLRQQLAPATPDTSG
jgi:bifunctional DNase/RNase